MSWLEIIDSSTIILPLKVPVNAGLGSISDNKTASSITSVRKIVRRDLKIMAKNNDSAVYQLKNGRWGYRFSISVDGQKIARRGRTDLDGNPLLTRAEALKARKKAIKMAQLAPLVSTQPPAPVKKTVRDLYAEYREKGCSDRAYNTLRKQDSIWKNHLDARFRKSQVLDASKYLSFCGNHSIILI